jgi:hypothetical protein
MAWRVALQRLHGMLDGDPAVMQLVGRLKNAVSAASAQRLLDGVRKGVNERLKERPGWSATTPLMMRAALATVERTQKLLDRLKARGVLRES